MESALITRPLNSRAIATARADLPLAVGPPMTITGRSCPLEDCSSAWRRLSNASGFDISDIMMKSVLTLVTSPDHYRLSDAVVAVLAQHLHEAGASTDVPSWLAEDTACDLPSPQRR